MRFPRRGVPPLLGMTERGAVVTHTLAMTARGAVVTPTLAMTERGAVVTPTLGMTARGAVVTPTLGMTARGEAVTPTLGMTVCSHRGKLGAVIARSVSDAAISCSILSLRTPLTDTTYCHCEGFLTPWQSPAYIFNARKNIRHIGIKPNSKCVS